MIKLRPVFLALALCVGPLAAGAAVAQTPPPAAGAQAPADAGRCIWGKVPLTLRVEALAEDTALKGLNLVMDTLTDGQIEAAARSCGVENSQFSSAGERLTRWMFRLWGEKRLEGRWTAARLDAAYRAIPAADMVLLKAALTRKGEYLDPEWAALERFFGGLGLDMRDDAQRVPGFIYLIARVRDEP